MNIGQAARAMNNSEITRLKLVDPEKFHKQDAYMMACNSRHIVDEALYFDSLEKALEDETCSFAFSRRTAKNRVPYYSLEEMIPEIVKRANKGNVTLVFGREADGLTREELYQCDYRVYIPTSEKCGSLNLAQAVLIACHEIFKASGRFKEEEKDFFADNKTINPMLKDLDKLLIEIGYNYKSDIPLRKKIIQNHKEIFGRAGLQVRDVNMFLGIFSKIRSNLKS